MCEENKKYGANNIAHWFSKYMEIDEWLNGLTENELENLKIDNYSVYDFLLGSESIGKVKDRKYKHMPIPTHMVIKHKNQGKIESHKWFFKGFCETMSPQYVQIIDWGSIALWNSISYIIMHMENYPNIGGAWGEIEWILSDKKNETDGISFIESVILRTQYVEYKVSHYLDKASESLFGFVSVLPGAFSAFRWNWIKGDPLNEFLKGAKDDFADLGNPKNIMKCSDANKYLAEDRIMWLEIIGKKDENFIIEYIPGAKCLTDPPLSLSNLIKQRRRWYNGSLFASFHVLSNIFKIQK